MPDARNAGALRERLHFQRPSMADDGFGNLVPGGDFQTQFTVSAALQPLKGTEAVTAARLEGRQPYVVTIRQSAQTRQVNSHWRMVDARDATRVFEITAPPADPDMRNAWLQLLATQRYHAQALQNAVISIKGTAAASAAASAVMGLMRLFEGAASATSSAVANIGSALALQAGSAACSVVAGSLWMEARLGGSVGAASASAAGITLQRNLSGQASALSGSAAAVAQSGASYLAGSSEGLSGGTGGLSIAQRLLGAAAAVSVTGGAVDLIRWLEGIAAAQSAVLPADMSITDVNEVEAPTIATTDYFAATGATQLFHGGTEPPALRSGDKYLFALETWHPQHNKRQESVVSYDRVSKRWTGPVGAISQTIDNDDHGVPSLMVDHQGYFHIFGAAHGGGMQHSISRYPGDASHWNKQNITALVSNYTYPHPNMIGGVIYLFMRKGNTPPATNYPYVLRKSTSLNNGVITWGPEILVGDFGEDSRWYTGKHIARGTEIHMTASKADFQDGYRRNIYYLIFDTLTDTWTNIDRTVTKTGTMDLATANASFKIYTHADGQTGNGGSSFCFDSAGRQHFLYQTGPFSGYPGDANGHTTKNDIYHIMYDGGTFSAPFRIGEAPNRYDNGGISPTDDGGVVVLYVEDTQLKWPRGGDILKRTRSAEGVWSSPSTVLLSADFPLVNPTPVQDGGPEARLVFCEYSGNQTDERQLKGWAYGDGGLLKRPIRPSILSRFNVAPSAGDATKLADLETALLDQGILQSMDLFYLFCAPSQQGALLNWAQEAYDLVINGSPVFTPNRGFTGVANGWLDTGFSSFNLRNITPTSVTLGIKCLTATSTSQVFAKPSGSGSELIMNTRNTGQANKPSFRLHEGPTATQLIFPVVDGLRHYTATKTGETRTGYVDGASVITDTLAINTAAVVGDFSILRSGTTYSLNQVAALYAGGYLPPEKVTALHTALNTYFQGVGITM